MFTNNNFFQKKIKLRQRQDLNLRGQSPMDFKSISLTTRTRCLILNISSAINKYYLLTKLDVDNIQCFIHIL